MCCNCCCMFQKFPCPNIMQRITLNYFLELHLLFCCNIMVFGVGILYWLMIFALLELQKTRKVLALKIEQLNAAIDDVSAQLRSEDASNGVAVNSEVEAAT
ncbi:unnamed protein product [Lupinus luteus]|uniref:Uncharacterized protein n=1 Tax=Lupinus luteus TaxID=3873 RepID=A0AAV1W961_LUPLU